MLPAAGPFCNEPEHSVLNKACPQKKLVDQSLTDLGKYPNPAHSSILSHIRGEEKMEETQAGSEPRSPGSLRAGRGCSAGRQNPYTFTFYHHI